MINKQYCLTVYLVSVCLISLSLFVSSCSEVDGLRTTGQGNIIKRYGEASEKPPISEWKYEIKAGAYTFLVKEYVKEKGTITIKDFYMDTPDGKWVHKDAPLTINEKDYQGINITRHLQLMGVVQCLR